MVRTRSGMVGGKTLGRTISVMLAAAAFIVANSGSGLADTKLRSIVFVNPLPRYPAWRLIGDCVAKRAKELGIPETETGPTTGTADQTVMIQQIQQGIANKAGAILTYPVTSGFNPILEQARKEGIVVGTFYGTAGTDAGSNVNIGANFTRVGEIYTQAIAARGGQQHVGLIVSGPTGAGKAFTDGFRAAAAKVGNVSVDAVVFGAEDASKALDLTSALLTAHPEINVVASHAGTATQGGTAAIKAKHLVGKVVFVANGPAGGGSEGLENGTIYKLMMQDLCTAGGTMVEAVGKIADGEQVPAQIDVSILMVGKGEIAEYLAKGWQ